MKKISVLCPRRLRALALLLVLCGAVFLASCGMSDASPLSYQTRPMRLRVAYHIGATSIEAELTLAAGDATRDMSLTILSPSEVAGITFTRTAGVLTATQGDLSLPMMSLDAALLPLSLFCIPADATVGEITKEPDGGRTITLSAEDTVWTLCLPHGASVPSRIDRSASGHFFSLTILEHLMSK